MPRGSLHPAVRTFVDIMAEVVAEGGGEEVGTQRVAAPLEVLLRTRSFLAPPYRRPSAERYVIYPLWVAPSGAFSVAAAVWNVGQRTPIHDHTTWGVVGIYEGIEHETRYRPGGASIAPLRLGERDLRAGEVIVCCTSDQDIHEVRCGSAVPCVGIHVYGADIGTLTRHRYDPLSGERTDFVSRWAELS